ncbi:sensor histidine kinase [Dawidia soli]|uniref:histidine kinase n=1 Tax=Dawidia soli TaxID=2782352 RepID=A0AAP2DC62_9BACT|nr:HAMP domain-containing sensor histidine kinase [Dawidia soli]MBT1686652.1 HAMP domain-containing histidine kinase [Dawidia soli]
MKGIIALLWYAAAGFSPVAPALQTADSVHLAGMASQAYGLVLSQPDSSIALAHAVLSQVQPKKNLYLEAYSYYVLSKANWTKANYRLSTEYGYKALRLLERDPHAYATLRGLVMLTLARTFIDRDDYAQAEEFLNKARHLAEKHHDDRLLADTYRETSALLSETEQYDSAIAYADKGIAHYLGINDSMRVSILYGRKAKAYLDMGDYARSDIYNRKSMTLDSLVGNTRALGFSYYYAADIAYRQKQYIRALHYVNRSIALNERIHNMALQVRARSLLAEIYTQTGRGLSGAQQFRRVSILKDSLYNAEKSRQIQEMQSLYALEAKDRTIETLGQKNLAQTHRVEIQRMLMLVLAVGVVLLAAVVLLLVRLRILQQRANQALAERNLAMEQQKEEIESQAEFLQQLNQLKSKLFSVISHDLRGPIANLQSLLHLLTANIMTPQEFIAVSDKLKTNLNSTQRTLENLLNWSLSQMDGIRTEKKTIALQQAVDEASGLLAEFAERKQVTLDKQIGEGLAILADANQLQLILRNLLHNAIKFSKSGGTVIVSAVAQGTMCTLRVRDYGIGLTADEKARLLNSHEYFTKTGTQQEKGTGLGFLLCQEFISRNDGTLDLSSTPGEGTEVSISLPQAPCRQGKPAS